MRSCGLVLWHDALLQRDGSGQLRLLSGLEEFREHLGGRLTLAMPTGIGSFVDVHALPDHIVEQALRMLQAADRGRLPADTNALNENRVM
jgi:3-dehydroquinate synthase